MFELGDMIVEIHKSQRERVHLVTDIEDSQFEINVQDEWMDYDPAFQSKVGSMIPSADLDGNLSFTFVDVAGGYLFGVHDKTLMECVLDSNVTVGALDDFLVQLTDDKFEEMIETASESKQRINRGK